MAQTTRDEESTEIVSDDGEFISTGYSCSEYSQDRKDQQPLNVEDVKDLNGAENSYDPDATYIDVSKLPSRNGAVDRQIEVPSQDVSCSQEVTQQVVQTQEIDVFCSQEPTQPVNRSQEVKSEDLLMTQPTQDSTSCSQESTQPVSQEIINTPPFMPLKQTQDSFSEVSTQPVIASQEIECSPPDKNDVTLELTPSQDIVDPSQDNKSDMGIKGKIDSLGRKESNESDKVHSENYQSSLSSGSRVGSSSSSSKRPTDSDDTDDLANGSQDMFESQNNSQPPPVTVSQFLPTLQLSGDIPSSQGYEGFRPNLLCPSSPTAGSTSTPLRPIEKRKHDDIRGEVISLSDEDDVLKLSEKRKLSDSSDENKPEVKKAKTNAVDTRQSIVILGEVNPSRKPSTPDSEDPSASSQAFQLYLSETVDELDLTQDSELMHTSTKKALLHKLSSPSQSMDADTSVVQLEDDAEEDEVQCVSSQKVKPVSAEIVLDSSGQQLLSKSGDVEVLSPSIEHTRRSNQDFKSIHNKVESLPFEKCPNILSPPVNKSFIAASSPGESLVHDLDNAKENIRPGKQVANVQEFEGDFLLTFTCTYKVSCKSVVDMSRKEPVTNSITSFDVLESKTVQRRDSSPSAVEESGGGSPGSIASGPGPFKLQPSHAARFSMMSSTSSSSTNSSVSTYRQAPAVRGRAAVPMWNRKHSPVKPHGLVPWKELLSGCQNELAESGSEVIDSWVAGNMNNTSSDDSKTIIEEKTLGLSVLPEVEDDGEDVMSIPLAAMRRAALARSERTNSSTNSAASAKNEQSKEELVIKSECETPSKRRRGRPPKTATPSKTPRSSAKKKAPTPRNPKNTETLLAGDQSSVPEDSSLSSGSSYFAPGSLVFAEWNGFYYPGKIENSMQQNQWNVTFHDGFKKVLNRNEIVLINTFEIGQQLLVQVSTEKYRGGEVIDVTPLDSGEDLFTVKFHKSGDKIIVPISKLCLSKQQVKEYLQERPASAASTCSSSPTKRASSSKFGGSDREILKNLDKLHDLPGKRIRTPKGSQSNVSSPSKPGPSSTARQLIPDGNGSSTADDEPLATTLALGANIIVKGVHPEKVGFETADPLARKGKGVKNRGSKKRLQEIEDESVVKQLGPIPPEGSRIFAGYSFFITQTDVQPKHRPDPTTDSEAFTTDVDEQPDSNDMDQCPSDSESFKFTFLPMVKDRLAHQIIQGGGKVLKDWTDIVPKDIKKTYVVSNRPCLTPIFLHCLVRGVRGVNHDYIIYCCRQACNFDSCLKSNLLPIGYSHIIKDFIPWGDQKSISSFLIGENILVVGNKNFKNFWDDFLNQTGAKVSSVKSSRGMSMVTKVLSDNPCPESYIKRAQEMGIPIVSPAWVTQSLINNSRLSADRHPSFKYDYVELD